MRDPRNRVHQAFEEVGSYNPSEARQLLARLVREGIRFEIETTTSCIQGQQAFRAANGGTFGAGAAIRLFIWSEDRDAFNSVHNDLFHR